MTVSFFNSFKNNYKNSDYLEDMENKMSDLMKLNKT